MGKENLVRYTVAKAAGIVIIMNLVSKILGFIRDAVIAKQFGASSATDSYLVAYTLPYAIQAVLGMAFVSVVVPVITSYLIENKSRDAWKAASIILNWIIIILVFLTGLGLLLTPQLVSYVAPGFDQQQKLLTIKLTRIIFPSIIFMGSGMLITGFLNAGNIFGIPALAPGLTNVIIILTVLVFGDTYHVEGLAVGTLAGFLGFFLLQVPVLRKVGFKYYFVFDRSHPALQRVLRTVVPVSLSVAVNQAYLAINRIFASGLQKGSITSLDFGYRLMSLPLGIFVFAIATAIYPELSRKAAEKNYSGFSGSLLKGLNMIALISIPAAIGLIVLRYPLVKIVFERGAFDSHATQMTADSLLYFSVGLFAMGANLVITRAYYAMGNVKVPFIVGLISVIIDVILSFIFIPTMGHKGLALANSLAASSSVLFFLLIIKQYLPAFNLYKFLFPLSKILVAAGIMGIIVDKLLQPLTLILTGDFLGLALLLIISAFIGALVFAVLTYIMKVEELNDILSIFLKKLKITS